MSRESGHFKEFGKFRLDAEKKVLWCGHEPVELPLKEIELLCVLTETSEVIGKEELLNRVWAESFVEESNLSRHIYRLRKAFKKYGESEDLIQTVPKRGYRFTGEVHETQYGTLAIEKHSISRTLVEEIDDSIEPNRTALPQAKPKQFWIPIVASLMLVSGAFGYYFYNRTSNNPTNIKSIAVLPLKSFDSNKENEEIGLRITDAVTTKLGGLTETSVRPTNSVLRFAKKETDAVEVGKILRVEAVLDGRIQVEGEKLRVTLQLISVKNGESLWTGQFDGNTNQILFLQDRISTALLPKLSKNQVATLVKNPTTNPQAFELYSRGRYFWSKRTPDGYWKALDCFQKAVQEDPNFALAFTGIADTYILLNQSSVLSPDDAFPKADDAAKKALFLDENLSEAHTSLATINNIYRYDWENAEKHYKLAIELNPNSGLARAWYGMLLITLERFEEAQVSLKKAEELDPTSLNIAVYLLVNLYMSRQYDEVTVQFQKTLELDANITTPYAAMSHSYEMQGKYNEAVETELKRRTIVSPESVEPLRTAFKTAGMKGFWKKEIELLKEEVKSQPGLEYRIAGRYAILGDNENALAYVEKYSPQRGSSWSYLKAEPIWDNIRDEPRFQTVLRKMNLTE